MFGDHARQDEDICECGCPRRTHAFGFLACQWTTRTCRCYRCWWFRLARRAPLREESKYRTVRFECGCTRYVAATLVAEPAGLLDVYCALVEHASAHGVEVVE